GGPCGPSSTCNAGLQCVGGLCHALGLPPDAAPSDLGAGDAAPLEDGSNTDTTAGLDGGIEEVGSSDRSEPPDAGVADAIAADAAPPPPICPSAQVAPGTLQISCGRTDDRSLVCWGTDIAENGFRAGDSTILAASIPVLVPGFTSTTADVATGAFHACALR